MTHELLLKVFKGVSLIDLSDCTFEYFDEENELCINANFEGRVIDSISYDGNLFYMMDNDGIFIALNPMKSAFDIAFPTPQTDASGLIEKYSQFYKNIEWHIKTNQPIGDALVKCQSDLDHYAEILTDLKSINQSKNIK